MTARWMLRLVGVVIVGVLAAPVLVVGRAGADPTNGFPELIDVRVARHDTFDRIVFEFDDGAPPGASGAWEPAPIIEDPTGFEVAVDGNAFLRIVMHGTSGFDFVAGVPTYTGPTRIALAGGNVVEVVKTGDFEATMSWVAGVNQRAPFTVTTLEGPPRVIVDIQHAAPATPVAGQPKFTG